MSFCLAMTSSQGMVRDDRTAPLERGCGFVAMLSSFRSAVRLAVGLSRAGPSDMDRRARPMMKRVGVSDPV